MTPTPQKTNLTSDIAEKVLLADLSNILKKAKSGKPLSKYERDLIAKHKEETAKREAAANEQESNGGRPRTHAPGILPIFDSMQACFAGAGIPVAVQKQAKNAGCDAFRSNRVYLEPLLRWLFSREGDDSGIDWNQELAKEKTKRERVKRLRDEKLIIDRAEARHGIQAGVSLIFSILDRLFLGEAPAGLKGKTEMEIYKWGQERIEEIRKDLPAKFAGIGETE